MNNTDVLLTKSTVAFNMAQLYQNVNFFNYFDTAAHN